MKVFQVVPVLNFGGIETHRFLIAKYHKPEDYDLSFCCLSKSGATAEKIEQLGYKITYLHESVKILNFRLIFKLYRLLKKEKPDVVHACAAEANFYAMIAAYLAGVPVRIAEEIGLPSQSKKAKKVFHYIYSLTSAVIGVSLKVSDYLVQENKVPNDKVKTIYNPYDIEIFNKPTKTVNEQNSEFNILSVGRLVKEKNHLFLIKSIEQVIKKYPNVKLKIVGDGPLRYELETYIKINKLEKHIELLGFREDIAYLLQNSDLFVLPSKLEGLGISLIEAMAMGTLVIGTDAGGIPEVILEEQSMGWIVPSNDIQSMAKSIENVIILTEDEREIITNNAKRYVEEKFSPFTYIDNLYNLYRDLRKVKNS